MIIFLLLVIIAIMLPGSSVFLGVVGAILGIIVGVIALAMLMDLWESLGTATQWAIVGVPAALALGGWVYSQRAKTAIPLLRGSAAPPLPAPSRTRASYVWTTFADALDGHLAPDGEQIVRTLIEEDADQELSRFCNSEIRRIYGDQANAVLRRSVENSPRRRYPTGRSPERL